MGTVETVRLFVIGIACAGKTTLARRLRACPTLNIVDMDDEIARFNGGTWPDIPTKNNVVLPKVLAEVRAMSDLVLFGSLNVERTQELRTAGFSTALLDVSEAELRRRHAVRLAEEGWTNVEWFEHEQSVIRELRAHNVFDHVIDGEGTVASIADDIMKLVEDLRYDPTIYLGSAKYCVEGRPAYSAELASTLTKEVGLDGTGRLLDVGCGPGVVALELAGLFTEVIGLDPDADMLWEAASRAEELGVENARWVHARAEDIEQLRLGACRVVTFGQSFHWTDRERVAETIYDLLEPGGALVLIVHTVEGHAYRRVRTLRRFPTTRSGL